MRVSGFTFIRNAITYDYPIVEAIRSILPLCDEVVVAVGNSTDDTLALIQGIGSAKIRIIETVWDDAQRESGRVLALETDKALAAISPDADWAFYIQGDEVLHERYLPVVQQAMADNLDKPQLEGLLFNYIHFYGSYQYVGDSRRWYRREIRIIRNTGRVASYRDAQGFRTIDGHKLKVQLIDATIYHYGWVKHPDKQRSKIRSFSQYWHSGETLAKIQESANTFDYSAIDALARFTDTHPAVMQPRIDRVDWSFVFDTNQKKYSLKNRLLLFIEKWVGWRIGEYRNYILVKGE